MEYFYHKFFFVSWLLKVCQHLLEPEERLAHGSEA